MPMKQHTWLGAILVAFALLSFTLMPTSPSYPTAKATATPLLQVWSQDFHTNNLTGATGQSLGPGATFLVVVNVTNAGPITGFDIQLNYAISPYLNPPISTALDSSGVSLNFVPGLFDGSKCQVVTAKKEAVPAPYYDVRVAAVFQGTCNDPAVLAGTGTLFSVQFSVVGVNATSIDVQQAGITATGKKEDLVLGPGPAFAPVPGLQVSNMIFQNKAGTLPVAQFSVDPPNPGIGQQVSFNGTDSYLPGSQSQTTPPFHGITKMLWSFGGSGAGVRGDMTNARIVNHVFLLSATQNASGYYPARLVIIGSDPALPARMEQIIFVNPGKVHNVAIAITADKTQANVGDKVGLTVTIANRGNQNEQPLLNVSYDFSGTVYLDKNKNLNLPIGGHSTQQYSLDTSSLVAKSYTVIASVYVLNNTATSAQTTSKITFILNPAKTNVGFSLDLPTLAIGGVIAVAAIVGVAMLFRRRRAKDDSALE